MAMLTVMSSACCHGGDRGKLHRGVIMRKNQDLKRELRVQRRDDSSKSFSSGSLRQIAIPLAAAILFLSPPNLLVSHPETFMAAEASTRGAALFNKACIGCHVGGGNILQPGASLFTEDLERNGIVTEEEIYNITYFGKGRMPGFGEKCAPRGQCTFGPRLKEDEIRELAEFVRLQAANGWPKIELEGEAQ
ncbi:cytochrome c [Wolffia australiana]